MAILASDQVTLSCVVDVIGVWRYYKLQSSTLAKPSAPTAVPPSGWTDTEPTYTAGSTNSLYTCELVKFSDGTWNYSNVSLSSSYEAAKAAYNAAINAQNAAQNNYDKVNSRGEQLITNGNGGLGDNTNFSSWTFDGTVTNNSPGSFTKPFGANAHNIFTNEFVPVSLDKRYKLSLDAKSQNGLAMLYTMLGFYDIDKNLIEVKNHYHYSDTTTVLTSDLNAGDTVVHVQDVSKWKYTQYANYITIWNYTNSRGYTYPVGTYSRNVLTLPATSGNITEGTFNTTNNTVTLKSAYSGPTIPAGTSVSQGRDGASYKYLCNLPNNRIVPSEWTTCTDYIDGVDYSGTNAERKFVPGTAYVKFGALWNYYFSQDQIWITNIALTDVTNLSEVESKIVSYYGVCDTERDTTPKVVKVDDPTFTLREGVQIAVRFSYSNGMPWPYLKVDNSGAYQIRLNNHGLDTVATYGWAAGSVITFVFDGNVFNIVDSGSAYDSTNYVYNIKNNFGYPFKHEVVLNGDPNTYYPIAFRGGDQHVSRDILIKRAYHDTHPTEWNGTHSSKGISLNCNIKCNFGGWGGTEYDWQLHDLKEDYGNVFAGCQIHTQNQTYFFVFLRGGGTTGAKYTIYSDQFLVGYNQGNSFPMICYAEDPLGYSGGTSFDTATYQFRAPAPRTLTDAVKAEIASKKYIEVAANAGKTATNHLEMTDVGLVVGDMTASVLGRNILIGADKIYIRDGETDLATYASNNINLGLNTGHHIRIDGSGFEVLCDDRSISRFYDDQIRLGSSSSDNVTIDYNGMRYLYGGSTKAAFCYNYIQLGGDYSRNVYIDSDSVDIRNGTAVLASYEADKISLGKNSKHSTIDLCAGTGQITTTDGINVEDTEWQRLVIKAGHSIGLDTTAEITMDTNYYDSWNSAQNSTYFRLISGEPWGDSIEPEVHLGVTQFLEDTHDTCMAAVSITPSCIWLSVNPYNSNDDVGRVILSADEVRNDSNYLDLHINNAKIRGRRPYDAEVAAGELVEAFQAQNENGNTVVGWGNYNNGNGNTNIYGNEVQLGVASANNTVFRPYWHGVDTINRLSWYGAGYVSSSSLKVYFTIPLAKPVIGSPTVSITSSNGLKIRQNGLYLFGSGASTYVNPSSYSATVGMGGNFVLVTAVFTNSTNVVNNGTCGIDASINITFAYG